MAPKALALYLSSICLSKNFQVRREWSSDRRFIPTNRNQNKRSSENVEVTVGFATVLSLKGQGRRQSRSGFRRLGGRQGDRKGGCRLSAGS